MVSKKKRSRSTNPQENDTKKQKTIANFFASPATVEGETTKEFPANEEAVESTLPAGPETSSGETFFSSSMYTDEVDNMVSTIIEGERHLLNEDEMLLLTQYASLNGTFFYYVK